MNQVYAEAGIARWKFRPKHHYFEEMMMQLRRTKLNPRHLACWVDEGYLGHIKKKLFIPTQTLLCWEFFRGWWSISAKDFTIHKSLPKRLSVWVVSKRNPKWNSNTCHCEPGVLGKKSKTEGLRRARWQCGVRPRTGKTWTYFWDWVPKTTSNKTFGSTFFFSSTSIVYRLYVVLMGARKKFPGSNFEAVYFELSPPRFWPK